MSSRRECSDLPAGSPSGVYLLQPGLDGSARVAAFCDLDTDGGNWTIIQRRADSQPRQDFYLHWAAYREGFAELDAEFWWGLNNMWMVTAARDRRYELRINMEDFDGAKRMLFTKDSEYLLRRTATDWPRQTTPAMLETV